MTITIAPWVLTALFYASIFIGGLVVGVVGMWCLVVGGIASGVARGLHW